MAYIGTNMSVAVQSTIGSPLAVTILTLANPGVATSAGHGYSNGDYVYFAVTDGTVELDGQACRIANKTTDTFELEGVNTTGYSAWVSGTVTKVTAFSTLSSAQNITMPNAAPAKLDATRLIDKAKQYLFGLPDAPEGSITGLFNPGGAAEALIITATNNNARIVIKVLWSTPRTVFSAFVSGGAGFDLATNSVAQATISFTPIAKVIHYAT
jgi:hypothetical protein